MYLIIGQVDEYIEESNENKYLIFASANRNKEVLVKYSEIWGGTKNSIEKICGRPAEYEKYFLKIKLSSDVNLPLNRIL